jgi:4-amino-4-deoxy-L-arabinose transferase-like glycosyltransferase
MFIRFFQKYEQLFNSNKLPWIIIFIGITLRLIRYLYNPSLWFDESDTAIDIISRPFSDLINPSPDWSIKYPYGFLIIEKLAVQLFGNSEYALRFFPLISGIISFFLFYKVAKHYLRPKAVLIALGLFAILDPLIYYSSELKPYSSDLLFALLVFIASIYIESKKLNIPRIVFYGILGAGAIWFSHPSIFVLSGVGLCLAVHGLSRKEWSRLWGLLTVYLMWALSFIACYFIYIKKLQLNFDMSVEDLLIIERSFVPFPPKSLNDLKWIIDSFFEVFNNPVGLTFTGITAFAFLIGCLSIARDNKEKFYLLISPILFTMLASILHQYPFKGRLIVFLIPFMLLFIAEGVEYVREKISVKSAIPGMIFVGIFFIYPLSWAAYHAKTPSSAEEIRPAIRYIKDHWQKDDVIYVHYYSQYAFEYYTKFHPDKFLFDEGNYVVGIAPRGWYRTWRKQQVSKYYSPDQKIAQSSTEIFKEYIKDLHKLSGNKRVWVLFTSNIIKDGINEEKFFVYNLEISGKRLDSFGRSGIANVYLYDLSGEKS